MLRRHIESSSFLWVLAALCCCRHSCVAFSSIPWKSVWRPVHGWHLKANNYNAKIGAAPSSPEEGESNSPPPRTFVSPSKHPSKREMLKFAGPALGIYLSNPLLSNIDNAFVGRSVGTKGLAALSPGTVCTDQILYLFSFLSRATTGIVSKAYRAKRDGSSQGDTEAAREAASSPFTISLVCGVFVTLMYAFFTPQLLSFFRVNPGLRSDAASYIHWRGAAAWAALTQNCCLSILMSTRDSITPLKIIALSSALNVLGDALLCIWPQKWGCAGAAAATAGATIFSSAFMVRTLRQKGLMPTIRMPTRKELGELVSFSGPMFAITLTRLGGFLVMQRAAMALGEKPLAAYQLCFSMLVFFLLFGEPISQLSQTQLPSLIEENDSRAVTETIKSVLTLGLYTALVVGGVTYGMVFFGSSMFTSDPMVQLLARRTAPSIFAAVATAIMTIAVDGAMMASRDFGFMLSCGIASFVAQIYLLKKYCTSISFIFWTFTMRLGFYALLAMARVWRGYGRVGAVIRMRERPTLQQTGVIS